MIHDLPREIRRWLAQGRRRVEDRWSGLSRNFVTTSGHRVERPPPVRLTLEQPIPPTDHVAAKLHNLALARQRISDLLIAPGEIVSFWHLVGRPNRKRGFRAGRSLLGGELRTDYGGGLCQLSGALYHLSLLAGLRVLERHPHSVDIYDDATRQTPLGADATVAFGFKDLRIKNTLPDPFCFRIELQADKMTCELCCAAPIEPWKLDFVRVPAANGFTRVETYRRREPSETAELITVSCYQRLQ
jgi:vancomycin resistance protein VanW